MRWRYYIPHVDDDEAIWEDIYLYPEDGRLDRPAYMLTIDAVDERTFEAHGMTRTELEKLLDGPLHDADYFINGSLVTLRAPHFDRSAVLKYAKVWLEHLGHPCQGFVEATFDEMAQWAVSHHFPDQQEKVT